LPQGFSPLAALPPAADATGATRRLVTANRLQDGVPIYFAGGGRWSPAIDQAVHVAAAAADALLAEAQAGPPPHPAIGACLIDAALVAGRLRPLSLREQIRAFGPTTRSPDAAKS
jgi:hypothetical protein